MFKIVLINMLREFIYNRFIKKIIPFYSNPVTSELDIYNVYDVNNDRTVVVVADNRGDKKQLVIYKFNIFFYRKHNILNLREHCPSFISSVSLSSDTKHIAVGRTCGNGKTSEVTIFKFVNKDYVFLRSITTNESNSSDPCKDLRDLCVPSSIGCSFIKDLNDKGKFVEKILIYNKNGFRLIIEEYGK